MSKTVIQYKIYCETEGAYVSGWGDTPPTTCYNNNTHTVNPNSVQINNVVKSNEVSVIEDNITINRNAKVQDIVISDVEPNTEKTTVFVFPYNVSMYEFSYSIDDTNKGDELTISVNPQTNFGNITADVAIGDTVINVPPIIFLYGITHGFNAELWDIVNTEPLGIIQSYDPVNNTITTETPSTRAFTAVNTFLRITYKVFDHLNLASAGMYRFFDSSIGGSSVLTGTTVHFTYKNNAKYIEVAAEPKNFVLYITYLF